MKKKNIVLILTISISLILLSALLFIQKSEATQINTKEVTLYYLDERYNQYGVYIPKDYATSFQIEVTGTNIVPEYSMTNEDSYCVRVKDGLITPTGNANADATVNVIVGNETFAIKVNVKDYLDIYVENLFKDYIKANITDSMTQYQKMQKICEYLVKYEYNTSPDYRSIPLIGGGDCIANSHAILKMCDMLGITAYERYAANEPGAGSNHRNVSAILDGVVYSVEAGYNEPAPRDYTITEEEGGYRWGYDATTRDAILIQYDGFEENVVIPSTRTIETIDGLVTNDIKGIAERAFTYPVVTGGRVIKKVTLPNTITKIYDYAFYDCEDLTTVNIPANVSEIGEKAFYGCHNLTNLEVDPNNKYFTFKDGVLYNKDKTEVILCVEGKKGEVVLDENVKTIRTDAFSECTSLTGVTLGSKVETIQSKSFEYAIIDGMNIPKSVINIEKDAFMDSNIKFIKIEDGCKASLKNGTFFGCGNLKGIIIPKSVPSIEEDAFRAANYVTYYVQENSPALDYAMKNNKPYQIINSGNKNILSGMIILRESIFTYDGQQKKPEVTVVDGGKVLAQGIDYTVSYKDNVNAHTTTPTVIVSGKGAYSGTAEKTFTINKLPSDVSLKMDDVVYGEKPNPTLIPNKSGSRLTTFKYNTTPTTSGMTSNVPTEVGTYYVYMSVLPQDYNYKSRTIWAKFNIVQAENELQISCSNIIYGNTPKVTVLKNTSGGNVTYYYKQQGKPDSTYTTTIPKEIGKYTVKAVSAETHNYKSGTATANFEIKEKLSYTLGDVNADGKINTVDVIMILQHISHKITLTDEQILAANTYKDSQENVINTLDAIRILQYISHKITEF